MSVRVNNMKGTSNRNCKCGSWLKHWEKFGNRKATYCVEVNCLEKELVGAHVKIGADRREYIVPFCQAHNLSEEDLEINGIWLVSANKAETCEKI